MHSCRVRRRLTAESRSSTTEFHTLRAKKIASTGAFGAISYSMDRYRKISVSCVSNFREHRQTNEAGLNRAFSGPRALHNRKDFPYWNHKLAARELSRSRQLKIMAKCPEGAGSKVATLSRFCASLLYGVFSEIPSDARRRVHG